MSVKTRRLFPTIVLQTGVVLTGIGAVALLLWEPHIEGRNVRATLYEIYFKDPFVAYAYFSSIPFFVALHQAFRALEYIGDDGRSQPIAKALHTIKFCALAIVGLVAAGALYIVSSDSDDHAGGVFIGALIVAASVVVAAAAAKFERILQNAAAIKSREVMM